MKLVVKEKSWTDSDGVKHYYRSEELVSDDEFFTRKYSETTHQSSLKNIFDAYRDYCESNHWD